MNIVVACVSSFVLSTEEHDYTEGTTVTQAKRTQYTVLRGVSGAVCPDSVDPSLSPSCKVPSLVTQQSVRFV